MQKCTAPTAREVCAGARNQIGVGEVARVRDSGYSDNPELAPNCRALAHCQAYSLHFTDILAHRQMYSE